MDNKEMSNINVTELLIQISKDVASIKTDLVNFKEAQKAEKETIAKEIADVRADFTRDSKELESKFMGKFNTLQSIQNCLVGDIDSLKHADEKKDAKMWRTAMAYIGTAVGGMIFAKIPDIISIILKAVGK